MGYSDAERPKLNRYRAALDAGADPAIVAGWIAETQAERDNAFAHTRRATRGQPPLGQLTPADLAAILDELGDLVTALGEAEPEHKHNLYQGLGLRLTYHRRRST